MDAFVFFKWAFIVFASLFMIILLIALATRKQTGEIAEKNDTPTRELTDEELLTEVDETLRKIAETKNRCQAQGKEWYDDSIDRVSLSDKEIARYYPFMEEGRVAHYHKAIEHGDKQFKVYKSLLKEWKKKERLLAQENGQVAQYNEIQNQLDGEYIYMSAKQLDRFKNYLPHDIFADFLLAESESTLIQIKQSEFDRVVEEEKADRKNKNN